MKIKLKKYSEYKDSGVEWLGEIPVGWEVLKIKNIATMLVSNVDKKSKKTETPVRLCNYVDVYKNEFISSKIKFMEATASSGEIKKFKIKIGDVIITKDSEDWLDIGVPASVKYEFENLICAYHLAILRPYKNIIGGFLHRVIQSQSTRTQFSIKANGVTRYGISHRAILNTVLPIPPLPEQTQIARFLDHKTTLIDRAISQKEKLIELLRERRQVLIHQAVTRGLDEGVDMKDSGVEWIGEVPKKWKFSKLGFYIDILSGLAFPSAKFSQNKKDIPLLRGINISPNKMRWEEVVYWPKNKAQNLSLYLLKEKDIVVGMDRPLISGGMRVATIRKNDLPCLLLQRVTRIRATNGLIQNYLELLLKSTPFINYFLPLLTGVSVPHISPNQIESFKIGIPSLEEQLEIVEYCQSKNEKIRKSILIIQKEIATLKEYKTTLINSAVTGKIKIAI